MNFPADQLAMNLVSRLFQFISNLGAFNSISPLFIIYFSLVVYIKIKMAFNSQRTM